MPEFSFIYFYNSTFFLAITSYSKYQIAGFNIYLICSNSCVFICFISLIYHYFFLIIFSVTVKHEFPVVEFVESVLEREHNVTGTLSFK